MKLTRKIEQEVLKVYNTGWDAYMRGDLKTHAACLSSKFKIIGTTEAEHFDTKKAWLAFCKKTIHQVVGVAQMRKRKIKLDAVGDGAMVVENSNIYVLIEGKWQFYSKIRITALMQKEKTGWKYVHQHGSLPDMRASEDETIATRQIKKENQQLREAVKRRTIELEEKNRELEIESSLEKVRAQALGMRKSEDLLDICRTLYTELAALGFNSLRNTVIHVFHDDRACFTDYEYSDNTGGNITTVPFKGDVTIEKFINRIRKSENAFVELKVEGKELSNFKSFRKKTGQIKDNRLKQTKAIHYYIYSVGHASIGISSFNAIEKDKKELLKRFRNVFDFAYRRYTDIALAQAQVREAQIEAALERVRSRSLAMHKTAELQSVIHTVHHELLNLDISISGGSFIVINSELETEMQCWGSGGTADTSDEVYIPYYNRPFYTNIIKRIKCGPGFFTEEYTQQEKKEFFTFLFKHEPWSKLSAKEKKATLSAPGGYTRSCVVSKHTSIFIINHFGERFSDADNEILKRFGKVFEQAYTRFLDLQKAEAQAREAQIEVAVERVRAQSMAMHHPDDLNSVNKELLNQLNQLQISGLTGVTFYLTNEYGWVNAWDFSSPGNIGAPNSYTLQFDFTKYEMLGEPFRVLLQSNQDYYVADYTLEKLEQAVDELEVINPAVTTVFKEALASGKLTHQWSACARISNGILGVDVVNPPNEDTKNIVLKMAGAFNQAYTRFLDLQKAEAQAREAQIEAALERVRAQTMAMHNSGDVGKCVVKMFSELTALGVHEGTRFGIGILNHENENNQLWTARKDGAEVNMHIGNLDMTLHPLLKSVRNAWKEQTSLHQYVLEGEDLLDYYRMLNNAPDYKILVPIEKLPVREFHYGFIFNQGFFYAFSPREFQPELIQITKRFAKVFEQTYTRFLDLQKAEAQAREAQIEAALEKVRSRSLAMHTSSELNDVVKVLFEKLTELQVPSTAVGIQTFIEGSNDMQAFVCGDVGTGIVINQYRLPYFDHPIVHDYLNAHKNKVESFVGTYSKKDKDSFYDVIVKLPELNDLAAEVKAMIYDSDFYEVTIVPAEKSLIAVNDFQGNPLSENQVNILKRFAKVFDQTYTRFLDLQKSEAQAREAKIETALERVRAQAMAMHHSDDLGKTIGVYFEQLDDLMDSTIVRCGAGLLNKENTIAEMSTASKSPEGETYTVKGRIDMRGHPLLENTYEHWLKQKEYSHVLRENEIKEYYQYITNQVAIPENKGGDELHFYFPMFTEGSFYVVTNTEVPENELQIFRRFSSVLSLTYRRFNDLQKAEAQAREAQIEAALERVRSRSMAMHKSEELLNVITVVSEQLQQLNFKFNTVSFAINSQQHDYRFWFAILGDPNPIYIQVPYINNPMFNRLKDVLAQGLDFYADTLGPEESREWHEHVFTHAELPSMTEETKAYILRSGYARSIAIKPSIMLIVSNYAGRLYSDNENEIIKRFATVFEQSFTRFLDLQKAEAQAREAKIEAALERVRSKSLAMHKSSELREVVNTLYGEFTNLEVKFDVVVIQLIKDKIKDLHLWISTADGLYDDIIHWPYVDIRNFNEMYPAAMTQSPLAITLNQEETKIFFDEYFKVPGVPSGRKEATKAVRQIDIMGYYQKNTGIFLMRYAEGVYSSNEKDIIQRFSKVFEQTYTRFLDLQKAEAQTREAVKQSSLDRIRGEIASMRTTQDLDRITPLIWKELTTLNIPFVRCGVFIMDESLQQIHTFLSTPEGKAIAAFHLPYDAPGRTGEILASWMNKQVYIEHWDETAFSELGDLLVQQGALPSKDAYLKTVPQGGVHLHCLPFMQGMLYVGNTLKLKEDDIQLIQSVADAFATAYARYEDFNKLEAAKKQVDKALVELKQTQQQLVQSEKMASLGELTAGIAHEIQNPLNFVNNFSELNTELIDELTQELAAGNRQLAEEIVNDIKSNSEKILHHGKRADAIVKGMLQHSRSSSGVRELTDINALADEYLRLAYHGLRAKDKSFNAKFETHFDESIEKIEVVPQDIGRVILNLITNAFYAVNERKKQQGENFEPIVTVSSKQLSPASGGKGVEISVKDNGNGIPEHIKEKIFQPFFTTKPTGQGTGLGLSLSYDIVKAHGGELKVETTEGTGTTFTITLPAY